MFSWRFQKREIIHGIAFNLKDRPRLPFSQYLTHTVSGRKRGRPSFSFCPHIHTLYKRHTGAKTKFPGCRSREIVTLMNFLSATLLRCVTSPKGRSPWVIWRLQRFLAPPARPARKSKERASRTLSLFPYKALGLSYTGFFPFCFLPSLLLLLCCSDAYDLYDHVSVIFFKSLLHSPFRFFKV